MCPLPLQCQSVSHLFALYLQVLLQWRDTAWLGACHRHLKVTAVVEARKHLDIGELMWMLNSQKTLLPVYEPRAVCCVICTDEVTGWSVGLLSQRMESELGLQ